MRFTKEKRQFNRWLDDVEKSLLNKEEDAREKAYMYLEQLLQKGLGPVGDVIEYIGRYRLGSNYVYLLIDYGLDMNLIENIVTAIELCDVELVDKFLTPDYDLNRSAFSHYTLQTGVPLRIAINFFVLGPGEGENSRMDVEDA